MYLDRTGKNQNSRMALQGLRQHLGALDPQLYAVIFDS